MLYLSLKQQKFWFLIILLLTMFFFFNDFLLAAPAAADAVGDATDQINKLFCNVTDLISGPVAQGIAILVIVITGYSFFMGKVSSTMLFIISAGMLLVFAAPTLVPALVDGVGNAGDKVDCDALGTS